MQCMLPRETLARQFVLAPIGQHSMYAYTPYSHLHTNCVGCTCLEGIAPLLTTAGAKGSARCRGKLWLDSLCVHPLLSCGRAALAA